MTTMKLGQFREYLAAEIRAGRVTSLEDVHQLAGHSLGINTVINDFVKRVYADAKRMAPDGPMPEQRTLPGFEE